MKQKTGLVLLTLASGQFLMTLDSSVMNVSIATVAKDVRASGDGCCPSPAAPRSSACHRTILLIFGGLLVLWLFAAWERRVEQRGRQPLVQLSMFENRQFTGAS